MRIPIIITADGPHFPEEDWTEEQIADHFDSVFGAEYLTRQHTATGRSEHARAMKVYVILGERSPARSRRPPA